MRSGVVGCGWIIEWDHTPAMRQSDKVDIGGPTALPLDPRQSVYSAGRVPLLESRKAAAHAG
jgi:predicted dehydrogenase